MDKKKLDIKNEIEILTNQLANEKIEKESIGKELVRLQKKLDLIRKKSSSAILAAKKTINVPASLDKINSNQILVENKIKANQRKDINEIKINAQYARSLIEASLDPLVTISSEGKITDVNEASVLVTGIKRENLVGSDFTKYFTEPQKAQEGYEKVFKKGYVSDYPLTIKNVNGKLTDVLYNASVYKDEKGKVLGVFAAARDVTEQKWAIDLRIANKELAFQNNEKEKRAAELVIANKELAFQNEVKEKRAAELVVANKELAFQNNEKEKRAAELVVANKEMVLQATEKVKREIASKELEALTLSAKLASQYSLSLIEASRDPLFTISPNGKITDTNQASVSVTETKRENLIGTDFYMYFTEPEKARKGYEEVFKKGFVIDYPLTIRDGKLTDVLFNGSVYKDENGDVLGAVVVARDITEQKRITKELLESKVFAELATEIAEIAKAKAESATRIAEDAVKAKQQFLSNMSHEIRTPMNAIIGFTKVVLKTELTEKQREYLSAIKISGDALIVLINDILDLAKVDAGKMTFERTPFQLSASISAMLHLFETKIQEKNLILIRNYDDRIPKTLIGDPVRLHQIILNLVSNAIKFTNKGTITLCTELISEDQEEVKIAFSVSDTGIGIPENKIDKIFDNFQQATSGTSRIFGGTGLGLAIVKQLVEPQGGKITVKSTLGKGSVFSFYLSFQKTKWDVNIEPEIIEMNNEYKNIRVLVVEDIALNQLLMKTLLDEFGFTWDIAENGLVATEKMKTSTFDIILMDLQMPIMNGFDATDYIRNKLHSKIPIIALTADVTTVDLAKCLAVGMNDYVAKPLDEKMLYGKILSLVNKSSPKVNVEALLQEVELEEIGRCTDLSYLIHRTKSNPSLMMEMISLYLEQTPPLIEAVKKGFLEKDWNSLYAAIHNMIPSFSIIGLSTVYEDMAKKIQDFAGSHIETEGIQELIHKLEMICGQACIELKEEFDKLKKEKR